MVWEGLKLSGVSSKMVQQPTEPRGRTILWHWEGKGGEKSSAFINSFQGQKQSWAQVPMQPQPPFSDGPVQTAGRPGKDGAPLSLGTSVMDAEMSHQGQGSQQQPRGQAPTSTGSFILEKSLIKCNQFLCMGGAGGGRGMCHRTPDVNRYTNIFRPRNLFQYPLLVSFKACTCMYLEERKYSRVRCADGAFHQSAPSPTGDMLPGPL